MISSYIQLGGQSALILFADTPADTAYPANGFKRLILQGTGYTGAAAGEWYTVIGNCATEDIARCGSWSSPAGCTGGLTTFVRSPHAEVRDEQVGWWLQPDINCQAWFPIVAASESNHTVTIAGDHRALGTVGTRFRIYAPPGVATRGAQAGTLPKFAEAASSRCLYKGYRYETAAAGRWTSQGIAARQGGSNFTGQHYTLFRHFDPSLMRFTSLDPIAASQNLWAYCENNPHGSYDPDGLDSVDDAIGYMRYLSGRQNSVVEYLYRLKGAIDGAAFDIADYATFKQKFTDDDREAMQWKYDRDGRGDAYKWGGVVGGGTYVAVATLATGGYVGGQLAAGFAFYGGSAYVGGLAITGNALAWGIGGWVGGEVGTRMMHGRGQTNTEAAISFGFGAALGGIGQYFSAPRPMVPARSGGPRSGTYGDLVKELEGTGVQSNHLNQHAAFRSIIPKNQGIAVPLRGNAFAEATSPHFKFHASLEEFWIPYRTGGALFPARPTNHQYSVALEQALIRAGYTPAEAATLTQRAALQRSFFGLAPSDPVPRVPGRLPQKK